MIISNPKYGWCNFELNKFCGTPSYLTDVPVELLKGFLRHYKREDVVLEFDEEGTSFLFILTNTFPTAFLIYETEEYHVLPITTNIDVLAKDLIDSIESDFEGWVQFTPDENDEKAHREEILMYLNQLKHQIKYSSNPRGSS